MTTRSTNTDIRAQRRIGFSLIGALTILLGLMATGVLEIGPEKPPRFTVEFDIGTELDTGAGAVMDAAAAYYAENPGKVIVVTGHTGTAGDAAANQQLSQDRAETVRGRLLDLGIAPEHVIALGAGGTLPAERGDDISDAAYERSLPRAVIAISEARFLTRKEN